MEHSKGLEEFLKFLKDCEDEYEFAECQEKEMDSATQDILHELEFGEAGYHEIARLSKALASIRKERRVAKNKKECLQPINLWLSQNRETINQLKRVLGDIRKAEKRIDCRMYRPRTNVLEKINNIK